MGPMIVDLGGCRQSLAMLMPQLIPANEWANNHDFFKISAAAVRREVRRFMLQILSMTAFKSLNLSLVRCLLKNV
jgi:hypothetical protein